MIKNALLAALFPAALFLIPWGLVTLIKAISHTVVGIWIIAHFEIIVMTAIIILMWYVAFTVLEQIRAVSHESKEKIKEANH